MAIAVLLIPVRYLRLWIVDWWPFRWRWQTVANGLHCSWQATRWPALTFRITSWEVMRMSWQTPKIVEIACGCEINAYFPADL